MKAVVASIAMVSTLAGGCCNASGSSLETWPHWDAYEQHFIAKDGRVIDHTGGGHSTSEGQAYALFLALVAGDRARFDRVLRWADDNLADGRLGEKLPAWKWGQAEDGTWRVLDPNSASDAELWMAYTLAEAARLWCEPEFMERARALAETIAREEVADLPGLGPMLLPGRVGFRIPDKGWRLNPSYLPLPVLRGMATHGLPGPWSEVAEGTVKLLKAASEDGFVADWVLLDEEGELVTDPEKGATGSYDAIRVYLWAGMVPEGDPAHEALNRATRGPLAHWRSEGYIPEHVSGRPLRPGPRSGPPGFYAALLPSFERHADSEDTDRLRAVLKSKRRGHLYGSPPTYYDQNLVLFGEGFAEGRFRFDEDGHLEPRWVQRCTSP